MIVRLARLHLVLLGVGIGLAACRVDDAPARPIDDHVPLCCKAAAAAPLSFTGCRPSNQCRASETVWLRGPVRCGPLEAERCAGGRCCSLAITPATPPDEASIPGTPVEPIEAPAYVPETAPVVPMPFESP